MTCCSPGSSTKLVSGGRKVTVWAAALAAQSSSESATKTLRRGRGIMVSGSASNPAREARSVGASAGTGNPRPVPAPSGFPILVGMSFAQASQLFLVQFAFGSLITLALADRAALGAKYFKLAGWILLACYCLLYTSPSPRDS